MACIDPIKVFEHDRLDYGRDGFEERHWKALDAYNERNGGRYFTLTSKGVKFNQYVGVIQVDDLTIEILPKIGKYVPEEQKPMWQKVLLDMLHTCHWMQVNATESAALRFKPNSILEAYLEMFVRACEQIWHHGLTRKYRQQEGNVKAWKGKLLFNQQLRYNLVHQERFYTRHLVYDRNNIFNQILHKALKLLSGFEVGPNLKERVSSLLLSFPEMGNVNENEATFSRLVYDRKTDHYRPAIEIAAMLLLNYRPDIRSGQQKVLAILFDMNDLWEEYVYRQLIRYNKEREKHKDKDKWEIRAQRRKSFWQSDENQTSKVIKPDILVRCAKGTLVIDTKWKLPDSKAPSDADLKQMFVYNEYFQGQHAILLYPAATHVAEPIYHQGSFQHKEISEKQIHFCGMMYISALNATNQGLDKQLGERLIQFIQAKVFHA